MGLRWLRWLRRREAEVSAGAGAGLLPYGRLNGSAHFRRISPVAEAWAWKKPVVEPIKLSHGVKCVTTARVVSSLSHCKPELPGQGATLQLRVNGVDEVSENRSYRRFVFNVVAGAAKLESESDDIESGQTLSTTAAAGSQVTATPADAPSAQTGAVEPIALGADGFPLSDGPRPKPAPARPRTSTVRVPRAGPSATPMTSRSTTGSTAPTSYRSLSTTAVA